MMQAMRESTKPIFFVVIFAFIVGFIFLDIGRGSVGCSSTNDPGLAAAVAVVNGTPIPRQDYENYRAQAIQSVSQGGTPPSRRIVTAMENQAFHSLVEDQLLRSAALSRGLETNPNEVADEIFKNPPLEIRRNPAFNVNGQFDETRYYDALNDPSFMAQMMAYLGHDLPMQKLRGEIEISSRASSHEVLETHASRQQRATISYVRISPASFGPSPVELTAEEIQAYYEAHASDYAPDTTATITYAFLPLSPSHLDSLEAEEVLQSVYYELDAGEEFDLLMSIHSEAGDDMRGGPQGRFIGRNDPVVTPELATVLDTLDLGEVSRPFQDLFGLHIVTVDSMRTTDEGETEWRLKDIRTSVRASGVTSQDQAMTMLRYRSRLVSSPDPNWQAQGDSVGVVVAQPDPIDLSKRPIFIPRLPVFAELDEFVRTASPGAISEVYEGPAGWYVYRLDRRGPGEPPSLAAVEAEVRSDLARERGRPRAEELMVEARRIVEADGELSEVAALDSVLHVDTSRPFSRYAAIQGLGKDPTLIGAAFREEVSELVGPLALESGDVVVFTVDERDPAPALFDEAGNPVSPGLAQSLQSVKRDEVLASYLEKLRREANIKDLRPVRIGTL
jgi:hypothetical protein